MQPRDEAANMIRWSFFLFLLAIGAAVMGFGGFDLAFSEPARQIFFILFGVSLVLFFVSLTIFNESNRRRE